MSTDDFYSPPSASVSDSMHSAHPDGEDFAIVGESIRTRSPLVLPTDVCLKCGSCGPEGKTYDKRIYYAPKWILITIFISILITFILHLVLRKKLEVVYHLCPECIRTRRNRVLMAIGGFVASFFAIGFGATIDMPLLFGVGAIAFCAALVALVVYGNSPLSARSHSNGVFNVKGASPECLDQIRERRRDMSSVW